MLSLSPLRRTRGPRPAPQARPGRPAAALLAALVLLTLAIGSGRAPAGPEPAAALRKLPLPAARLAPRPGDPSAAGQAALRRQVETARRDGAVERLLGPRQVSRRSHQALAARGLGPARLKAGPGAAPAAAAAATYTLRILLVRISFDGDRSGDLTSVTTDGDFQYAPDPAIWIDPPPRDRRFFEAQLKGLDEFYRLQSGGRLVVRGRVLPEGDRDSYRVSDLADYGPGQGGWWTIEGLERLVRDMIDAADAGTQADGSANLADFDDDDPFTYVIFVHAGGDWQSDINGDSPNDVPTFFVSLGEPAALRGSDAQSGAPGRLSECSVIPETTNQDLPPIESDPVNHVSYGWGGGILAGLCHEFGHALGLVDIYDSWTGLPRVGIWDLMDAGTNVATPVGFLPDPARPDSLHIVSATGVLPPSLGVWEKWFLGWVEAAPLAGAAGEVLLPAIQVPRDAEEYARYRAVGYDGFSLAHPQAVYGGVSRREFFLVENRWIPALDDPLPETTGLGLVRDEGTGVILYLGGDPEPGGGPYRNTGLYDYFLLDGRGGLLVWHVDMAAIEAGLQDNTVNVEGRGLRLVEADGIQDVGEYEPYVLGFWGGEADPFNEPHETLNADGPPTSRAFDRSWTGLSLTGIAGADAALAVMRLTPGQESLLPAAPFELPPRDGAPRGLAADAGTPVAIDGQPFLLVPDAGGPTTTLFAVGADGRPRGDGVAAEVAGTLVGRPVFSAALDGGRGGVVLGLAGGTVVALGLNPGGPGPLPVLWQAAAGPELRRGPSPAAGGARFLCVAGLAGGAGAGELVVLDEAGQRRGEAVPLTSALLGDPLPVTGTPLWDLPCEEGVLQFWSDLDGNRLGSLGPWLRAPRGPVGGVVLRAGAAAPVVLADPYGIVYDRWGREPLQSEAPDFAIVAAADLDGDGEEDLLALQGDRLHALGATGVELTGWPVRPTRLFPLPDTTALDPGAIAVCDGDGDGVDEVLLATDSGHLLVLDARGALRPRLPFLWGEPGRAGLAVGAGADGARVLWLLAEGGRAAPPLERRLLGGRVAGWLLAPPAASRTSEWLGPQGGSARGGPVGIPAAIAGPAAAEQSEDPVVLYPNPVHDRSLRVRFHGAGGTATLAIFDLAGELVLRRELAAAEGLNDLPLELPDLATGLYLCRLQRRGPAGTRTDVQTLAVVR